ncbi:LD-carboxypeptidase, partial [archaeon]|nr:LD-carboxypeptidase [archaeon]
MLKPERLKKGDCLAIVSPSWGGPSVFPKIYEGGIRVLEKELGLRVKEYPTARADAEFLKSNPKARAEDINKAFADKEVKAIFATIGGDDSVRILPFLNKKIIKSNPKILMGYSDTTTLLTYLNQLGIVTFNGPAIMSGFFQWDKFPEKFRKHVKEILFEPKKE